MRDCNANNYKSAQRAQIPAARLLVVPWRGPAFVSCRGAVHRRIPASVNVRRPSLSSGRTKDLEPFACVSPGRDVLIDVSS